MNKREQDKEMSAIEVRQIKEILLLSSSPFRKLNQEFLGYKVVDDSSIKRARIVEAPSGNFYAYYIESQYCDLPGYSIVTGEDNLPQVVAVVPREVTRTEYVAA